MAMFFNFGKIQVIFFQEDCVFPLKSNGRVHIVPEGKN